MIETERLVLRPWAETDRAPFVAMMADPEVAYWLGGVPDNAAADAAFDRILAFIAEHGPSQFVIRDKLDGAFLGGVGLRRVPMEWRHPMSGHVEVGWRLARSAWGQGYATEAAAAAMAWGFDAQDTEVIHSWTARANTRSEAVMRRLGMTRAADLDFDHPDLAADHPLRPHVVYLLERG
jgi:RimJ/RimL family protein N-acetyltransferase